MEGLRSAVVFVLVTSLLRLGLLHQVVDVSLAVTRTSLQTFRTIVGVRDKRGGHPLIHSLVAVLWLLRRLNWREFFQRDRNALVVKDLL